MADWKPGELLRAEVRSSKTCGWITLRNTLGEGLVGPPVAKATQGASLAEAFHLKRPLDSIKLFKLY